MVWDTEFLTVQCGPFRDGWLQGHSAVSSHRAGRVPEGSKYWGAGLMRPRFSYGGNRGWTPEQRVAVMWMQILKWASEG